MKNLLTTVTCSLLLSGCAAIALNGGQQVKFNSDPPGATVQFRGQSCVTPCALTVPRGGNPATVEFSMDGRESYFAEVARAPSGELPRTDSGAGKAVIGTAVLLDAIIWPVGFMNEMSGLYQDWPKELNATLPAKSKGTALMKVVR